MAKLPKGLYQRGSIFWTKVYQHGQPIYQSTSTSNVTEATSPTHCSEACAVG
jgi:hypothetical protein